MKSEKLRSLLNLDIDGNAEGNFKRADFLISGSFHHSHLTSCMRSEGMLPFHGSLIL